MPYTAVDGYQIHYQVRGPEDGPPLIFIHGLLSSLKVWASVIDEFAPDYRCIALDLLGHGESQKLPGADLSIEQQGGLVVGLLDKLGIVRAVLVGHSMGGQIALWVASHHPERVERLVAIAAVTEARLAWHPRLSMGLIRLGVAFPRLGQLLSWLFRSPRNPLRWMVVSRLYFARPQPEAVFLEVYDEQMRVDNYACKYPAYQAIGGYYALDDAPKITAPTLIVGAAADHTVHPAQSLALKARLPQAELVMLPDCGHMVPYEAPQPLNAAMARFLNNSATARPTDGQEALSFRLPVTPQDEKVM